MLKAPRAYFSAFPPRIPAKAMIQTPKRAITNENASNTFRRIPAAKAAMQAANIRMKTPKERMPEEPLGTGFSPFYLGFCPHSGQNLSVASIEWPQLGHFLVAADGAAI